jgi:hypothetical protein
MKPEEQRIAIAEACGWKRTGVWLNFWISPCGKEFKEEDGFPLPDYLNDLNAMHVAEKFIKAAHIYNEKLELVVLGYALQNKDSIAEFMLRRATAAQRAEAFLRVLNLWKD